MRKWLAGKISALADALSRLVDHIYAPPELRYSADSRINHGLPPERRVSRGWD